MRIIAGLYKNRLVQAPKGLLTRPTSGRLRESLFNICRNVVEESRFLDLFAGSGAMGFEALSRGAKSAVFIDNSKEALRCIQANAESLGVEMQIQAIYGDVFEQLQKLLKRGFVFDIIYADPPYGRFEKGESVSESFTEMILHLIDEHIGLLAPGGHLFLEDSHGAVPEVDEGQLSNLRHKSSRKMGKSALQHYVRE